MKNRIIYRQQGFSLVELMVGMALGLFLMLGIAQLYIANNSSFRAQEGLAKIQEGGRFAMQRISSAVHLAGFFGCTNLTTVGPRIIPAVLAVGAPDGLKSITQDTPIFGTKVTSVTSGTFIPGKTLVIGSDTITLRGSGMVGVSYTGAVVTPSADIIINTPKYNIVEGDVVMIADCKAVNVFRATKDTTSLLVKHKTTSDGNAYNIQDALNSQFGSDAVVSNPYINTFFVADSGRTNYQGDSVMSLYLKDMSGNATELVEGVSDLQALYGVDTNNDTEADRYMDADEITGANNWDSVVSVRISLLVDSVDAATNAPADYTFQGASSTPTDRLLRKEFTGLFTLRSRAL